jgi:hypothetical protein
MITPEASRICSEAFRTSCQRNPLINLQLPFNIVGTFLSVSSHDLLHRFLLLFPEIVEGPPIDNSSSDQLLSFSMARISRGSRSSWVPICLRMEGCRESLLGAHEVSRDPRRIVISSTVRGNYSSWHTIVTHKVLDPVACSGSGF